MPGRGKIMKESATVECKREYTENIRFAAAAFANTDGGTIYIGVNDDGSVRGVEDTDAVMLRVTNMIRDAIRPDLTMFTQCEVTELEGRPVVAVTVQRGTARPYYLAGKGIRPEGVYVRQGASSVPASEVAILDMIKETSGDCYEESRSLEQQLTFTAAEDYFAKCGLPFEEQQKRTLGIIGEDGTYTNLGRLLSDQCAHTIKLAVFEGRDKMVFRDRRELGGSLITQMEEAISYIDRYNRTRSEFPGMRRVDRRDYPVEAIRESLFNAVTHRDYSFADATQISIFDDRIEFLSIGGLAKGVSFDDIMMGVSALRNRRLADVFYRLELIEAFGTGILKIRNSYKGQAVQPAFAVSTHAFKTTLPNVNAAKESGGAGGFGGQDRADVAPAGKAFGARGAGTVGAARRFRNTAEREEYLLQFIREQGYAVRRDVEEALDVSQPTAILILRKLTEEGRLVKEGDGKLRRYYVPDK